MSVWDWKVKPVENNVKIDKRTISKVHIARNENDLKIKPFNVYCRAKPINKEKTE
jgi:hypothetical protein